MKQKANTKKESAVPWIHPRHHILLSILGPAVTLYTRLAYHVTSERFKEQGERPYLILYNHQTPLDQFFPIRSFKGPVYHVATEDIFSNGWISSIIRWVVAPIPIKKSTQDRGAIRTILKVVKEGGTIAIAPEGNRTYSGKTEYINPSISHLAKMIHLPVALYRIEGGYGVQPRWSDKARKGRMRAYVSRVIEPEEVDALSKEELFKVIRDGLYVNEASADGRFASPKKAEYIERMVYVCPYCGLSEFRSSGDMTQCGKCLRRVRYNEDKTLSGEGFDFPFKFANDWYEYQKSFVNKLDLVQYTDKPMFSDLVDFYEVIPYRRKQLLRKDADLRLYGDRITADEGSEKAKAIPFEKITSAAVLGRNKLNIYYDGRMFQVRGDKHFNALKYLNIYHRYKNQVQGDNHGEFLGL